MVFRQEDATAAYTYASEPKALHRKQAKFREDEVPSYPANIMFDRRVVRGNTYAAQILPAEPPGSVPTRSTKARRRKAVAHKPSTPPPVHGRQHVDIQTDAYLEEVTDVIPEDEAETQTDVFLERPITPLFIPQKRGVDVETQIEDGDLFDFDFEVEPLLEVLVGKTLEQGLMEVLEEEELAAMRAHQEHFEQVRNAELVATQKMEAAERRKVEEKERRLKQEKDRLEREKAVRAKVAAGTFARSFMTGMVESVIESLWSQGHFYDPVERTVMDEFMPWLKDAATTALEQRRTANAVVMQLLSSAISRRDESQSAAQARNDAETEALALSKARIQEVNHDVNKHELNEVHSKAAMILNDLVPRATAQAKVDEARKQLEEKAQADTDAAWEELKGKVGQDAREQAEADKAAQDERKAATEAAAAEATAAAEEGDEGEAGAEGATAAAPEEEIDIEARVAEAVAAVERPEVKDVTDSDVLSALIEADPGLKDVISTNMALQQLGTESWIHDARFADELEPKAGDA